MPEEIRAKHYDVFVSYKREDDAAREVLCNALKNAGFDPWWDAKLGQGDFRDQLRDEINRCDVVIALWSLNAHAKPDEVKMEMAHAFGVKKLLPLKLDAAPIPNQFGKENFLPFDGWADEKRAAAQIAHILGEARKLGAKPSDVRAAPIKPTIPVDLGDLPAAPDKLIGRDDEMQLLRDAWNNGTNAVVLHALGGAGKSALLRAFVNERLAAGGDGAARIYGWSAYSQGSGDQKRADADGFISRALGEFGYTGAPIKDAVERARTLAKLIQKERVLLLLDGLEPLQDPPGYNKGRFKDKGLATLIKALGNQNPGLLVLTSRQEVTELEGSGKLVVHHALEQLSDKAGADLLVELGVRGRPRELQSAVHDLGGHALSVTLLGTYLAEVCGGDIHQKDRFNFGDVILSPEEEENADRTVRYAKRAEKVMAGYLEQFDKLAQGKGSAGLGGPERALLHVLGLFDRPADGPAVDMLLTERIPGLTDELFVDRIETSRFLGFGKKIEFRDITPNERIARLREAKSRLRKLRLLAKPDAHDPHSLDAHPVVRAYFSARLDETAPEAAKAAHEKLYHHYAAAAPDLPDTLEEMQPLFYAVQHGVKAGRVQEAFDELYRRRIERGNDDYINRVHGAFGADLAALAHFFKTPWKTPQPALQDRHQAVVLNSAAYALTALGRLQDSIAPQEASLAAEIASRNWRNAASAGGLLGPTLLILGRVQDAAATMELSLEHAETSGVQDERETIRAALAIALTAAGRTDRAAVLFSEAEELSRDPPLYSQQGYRYGDLLLVQCATKAALDRGYYQLELATKHLGNGLGLDDIAFGWLLVGRAQDALFDAEATASLDGAVGAMRKSGLENYIPEALLARAAHRRKRVAAGETALLEPLLADLAEIEDIAEPEMRLYLTDLALECARLALDVPSAFDDPRAEAVRHTEIAAKLIADTGYHRRDRELAELQARLKVV